MRLIWLDDCGAIQCPVPSAVSKRTRRHSLGLEHGDLAGHWDGGRQVRRCWSEGRDLFWVQPPQKAGCGALGLCTAGLPLLLLVQLQGPMLPSPEQVRAQDG